MRILKDICYGDSREEKHRLDLYLPACDTFPVFLYFHGGGLENGDKGDGSVMAEYLAERGIAVASANYRMYPDASYPDFIRDAAAAVNWVATHIHEYGQCEKLFIGGSSAGGYLSMMLCFDAQWLAPYQIPPERIGGFIHDAGQPTCHFNVLRERGIDSRRVIVDEASPLYHIGKAEAYPPMQFIVSDEDMPNRYEQTMLMLSTLRHFGYDQSKIDLTVMHGKHCVYIRKTDAAGESVFGKMIGAFIERN